MLAVSMDCMSVDVVVLVCEEVEGRRRAMSVQSQSTGWVAVAIGHVLCMRHGKGTRSRVYVSLSGIGREYTPRRLEMLPVLSYRIRTKQHAFDSIYPDAAAFEIRRGRVASATN